MNLRHPFRLRTDRRQAQLRLLATSDLQSHLMAWDYLADRPSPATGLVRAAALIRALRGAVPNALLFDNGDFLQGSPLSDWAADDDTVVPGDVHPMIAAMNALGYDAVTLGNHEFNYGLPFLTRALARAAFPVISANILTGDGRPYVPPTALLDRGLTDAQGRTFPLRIGVIGLAPPQITLWDRAILGDAIQTRDIVDTAAAEVPRLRAAGADIVIALAHTGIGPVDHSPAMENAAIPLAALPGIDAIVTGHTHQVFPGPSFAPTAAVDPAAGTLHGTPTVMPGFHGSHVGLIDLHLEHDDTRWHPLGHATRTIPVSAAPASAPRPDPFLDALAAVPHNRLLAHIRHEIGQTRVPIQGYFSLVAPDLTLQTVADAQRARAQRLLLGRPEADLPLLSAVAPFHAGGRAGPQAYVDIPAGPLRRRHASELYLYPNRLTVIALTGAQLSNWLEHAASLFLRITAGQTQQPLIDPDFPAYLFDVFDGLTYAIDPARPARFDAHGTLRDPTARRVTDIRINDRPLDPTETVLVATNTYRAASGAGVLGAVRIVLTDDQSVRDSVLDHLAGAGPLDPVLRPSWRFAPHPGTAAWFDTGPAALGRPAPPGATPLGPAPGGFHRFTLSLDPAHHRQPATAGA
jgi:2',3'-cyclic-nucleotide 2'-phosphodiesterase/3'-nucleotidase